MCLCWLKPSLFLILNPFRPFRLSDCWHVRRQTSSCVLTKCHQRFYRWRWNCRRSWPRAYQQHLHATNQPASPQRLWARWGRDRPQPWATTQQRLCRRGLKFTCSTVSAEKLWQWADLKVSQFSCLLIRVMLCISGGLYLEHMFLLWRQLWISKDIYMYNQWK